MHTHWILSLIFPSLSILSWEKKKGNPKAELFPSSVVTEPSQHLAADDRSQEGRKVSWVNMEARKGVEKVGRRILRSGGAEK